MSDPNVNLAALNAILLRISQQPDSLTDKLAAYSDNSQRLTPDFAAAYERLIAHLTSLYDRPVGPDLGTRMPAFLLPNQRGELISLDALLAKGPVVISMNRGHWCPYCTLDLQDMARIAPDIRGAGAELIAIMPERSKFTKRAVVANTLPFDVLSDLDLAYALSIGMIYWVGAEIKELYANAGIDLENYQDNAKHFLPVTAKFVLDRNGMVRAREVDVDFRQRREPQYIFEALAQL